MINYKEKPYYLSDEDIKWVNDTYDSMTLDERIGQLFCPIGLSSNTGYLDHAILDKKPGGILFRSGPKEELSQAFTYLQTHSKVPMFMAANLEIGGKGILSEGTYVGNQMAIAATGDIKNAYELGRISAIEGASVGANYAFAPVVDIDLNYHNPITNIRTYGDNYENTIKYAKEYIKGCNEYDMLTAIKHFPGDGVDERDQHVATTINSLSKEDWMASYGKVYKTLIDEGALSVMVGHIALPSFQTNEKYLPASISKELVTDLLKGALGFKGMVITDASSMVGFCCAYPRELAVPKAIMSGCDMFLFNKDYDEDIRFMTEGIKKGLLTEERLEEAVKKILATKAKINLNKKDNLPKKELLDQVGCEEFVNIAKKVADEACTLVKDKENILPINPKKHKKVLYEILGEFPSNARIEKTFKEKMESYGFEMIPYVKETFAWDKPLPFDSITSFKSKYDLVIYLGNIENVSNQTTNRINWFNLFGLGNNMPWFAKEVPTIFISLQNPYHMLDVPMIGTYINAYENTDIMIETVIEKMLGKSEFKGVSPIDPTCGREELK